LIASEMCIGQVAGVGAQALGLSSQALEISTPGHCVGYQFNSPALLSET